MKTRAALCSHLDGIRDHIRLAAEFTAGMCHVRPLLADLKVLFTPPHANQSTHVGASAKMVLDRLAIMHQKHPHYADMNQWWTTLITPLLRADWTTAHPYKEIFRAGNCLIRDIEEFGEKVGKILAKEERTMKEVRGLIRGH